MLRKKKKNCVVVSSHNEKVEFAALFDLIIPTHEKLMRGGHESRVNVYIPATLLIW